MATNVITTTATTRANLGADTVLTGFLKDVYLPGLTNTLFFDNALTNMIQKSAKEVSADGRRVVHAFETQRSTGVGPIAEGGDFRTSRPPNGAQGTEWLKHLNAYFAISGPVMRTVKEGSGSYIDAAAYHFKSIIETTKLDFERQITNAGDGRLCQINGTPGATTFVKGPAFFDTQFTERGMEFEVRAPSFAAPTVKQLAGNATSTTISSQTAGYKRASATAGSITGAISLAGGGSPAANGDWITRKDAYTSTPTCLEINGLMNLISDGATNTDSSNYFGVESSSNYTTVWGLNRTSAGNEYLKSYIYNVGGNLDEDILLEVLIELENQIQANPSVFVVDARSMRKYFINQESERQFITADAAELVRGFKGLAIQLGNKKLALTSLAACPKGYGFMINPADFAFITPSMGYKWIPRDNGQILGPKEGSDNYFASAMCDVQLVCYDPLRQAKLYGITST